MILPLFGGLSQIDILARLAALPNGVQAIRETFKSFTKENDFRGGLDEISAARLCRENRLRSREGGIKSECPA